MAGGPALPGRAAHGHVATVHDVERRELAPAVLGVLVGRGADFATAEGAVQEALIRALSAGKDDVPTDPTAWVGPVAWGGFPPLGRAEAAPRHRDPRHP